MTLFLAGVLTLYSHSVAGGAKSLALQTAREIAQQQLQVLASVPSSALDSIATTCTGVSSCRSGNSMTPVMSGNATLGGKQFSCSKSIDLPLLADSTGAFDTVASGPSGGTRYRVDTLVSTDGNGGRLITVNVCTRGRGNTISEYSLRRYVVPGT